MLPCLPWPAIARGMPRLPNAHQGCPKLTQAEVVAEEEGSLPYQVVAVVARPEEEGVPESLGAVGVHRHIVARTS